MKNTENTVKVGVLFVIFVLVLFFVLYFMGQFRRTTGAEYVIQFVQAGGISHGNKVRYAGVNIGRVSHVDIREAPVYEWDRDMQMFHPVLDEFGNQVHKDQAFVTILVTDYSVFGGKPPVFTDQTYATVTMSLMNERWIEMQPRAGGTPLKEGQVLLGRPPATIDEMMSKAEEAIENVADATKAINYILGDDESQENIKMTLENFRDLTGSLKDVSDTMQARISRIADRIEVLTGNTNQLILSANDQVLTTGSNMNKVTTDLQNFSSSLSRMTMDNEEDFKLTIKNLNHVSRSLTKTLEVIENLVTREEFSEDILGTLSHLKTASSEVEGIASDIRLITADPSLKRNLEITISEAQQAALGAHKLMKAVNRALGIEKRRPAATKSREPEQVQSDAQIGTRELFGQVTDTPLEPEVITTPPVEETPPVVGEDIGFALDDLITGSIEAEYNNFNREIVPNASVTLFPNSRTSYRLGVDSFGFDNLINLQYMTGTGVVRPKVGMIVQNLVPVQIFVLTGLLRYK
jgi:ABC-type transporter Mla subunit MlaD